MGSQIAIFLAILFIIVFMSYICWIVVAVTRMKAISYFAEQIINTHIVHVTENILHTLFQFETQFGSAIELAAEDWQASVKADLINIPPTYTPIQYQQYLEGHVRVLHDKILNDFNHRCGGLARDLNEYMKGNLIISSRALLDKYNQTKHVVLTLIHLCLCIFPLEKALLMRKYKRKVHKIQSCITSCHTTMSIQQEEAGNNYKLVKRELFVYKYLLQQLGLLYDKYYNHFKFIDKVNKRYSIIGNNKVLELTKDISVKWKNVIMDEVNEVFRQGRDGLAAAHVADEIAASPDTARVVAAVGAFSVPQLEGYLQEWQAECTRELSHRFNSGDNKLIRSVEVNPGRFLLSLDKHIKGKVDEFKNITMLIQYHLNQHITTKIYDLLESRSKDVSDFYDTSRNYVDISLDDVEVDEGKDPNFQLNKSKRIYNFWLQSWTEIKDEIMKMNQNLENSIMEESVSCIVIDYDAEWLARTRQELAEYADIIKKYKQVFNQQLNLLDLKESFTSVHNGKCAIDNARELLEEQFRLLGELGLNRKYNFEIDLAEINDSCQLIRDSIR